VPQHQGLEESHQLADGVPDPVEDLPLGLVGGVEERPQDVLVLVPVQLDLADVLAADAPADRVERAGRDVGRHPALQLLGDVAVERHEQHLRLPLRGCGGQGGGAAEDGPRPHLLGQLGGRERLADGEAV
jgi:hypothetical protein